MTQIGHNSNANVSGVAADRLRSFIERVERLEDEKKAIAGDIKEVFTEAKCAGFDTKILRQVIRRRRMDKEDREEQDMLLETYERALITELLSE